MPADPSKWEMVDDAMVPILQRKSPAEKLAIVDSLWSMARRFMRAQLMNDHPDWTTEQIDRETARRMSHDAD